MVRRTRLSSDDKLQHPVVKRVRLRSYDPPTAVHLVGLAVIWLLVVPGDAWAYIDPVAGSTVLQAVLAAGLAGAAYLWKGWARVADVLKRGLRRLVGR